MSQVNILKNMLKLWGLSNLTQIGCTNKLVSKLTSNLTVSCNGSPNLIIDNNGNVKYIDININDPSLTTIKIPEEIGKLTGLTCLIIEGPLNSSSLPLNTSYPFQDNITELTLLNQLGLNNLNMTGTIMPNIGNLTALTVLELGVNKLSGQIPSNIEKLTLLQQLLLENNQLSGQIPDSICNLPNLGKGGFSLKLKTIPLASW